MNLRQKAQTDHRLWLVFSALAFVLLGFVSMHTPAVEGKVGPSYFWGVLVTALSVWKWEGLFIVAIFAVVVAIPAAVFGWVAQAVVVSIRTKAAERPNNESSPN
jgi:hypothetical protein